MVTTDRRRMLHHLCNWEDTQKTQILRDAKCRPLIISQADDLKLLMQNMKYQILMKHLWWEGFLLLHLLA